jgi:hypothetical protein
MSKFDPTKAKEPNRYEMIGMEKETVKILNHLFGNEIGMTNAAYCEKKMWCEQLQTYSDYECLRCFYLNEANDLMFEFWNYNTEEEVGVYRVDIITWNTNNNNPLIKIEK